MATMVAYTAIDLSADQKRALCAGVEKGVVAMTCDGKECGGILYSTASGKTHDVKVVMG